MSASKRAASRRRGKRKEQIRKERNLIWQKLSEINVNPSLPSIDWRGLDTYLDRLPAKEFKTSWMTDWKLDVGDGY